MSGSCFDREGEIFVVLVNDEDQYSIWPHWKAVPAGWSVVEGVRGEKPQVLEYIEKTWTDMRPRSLRQWMEAQAKSSAAS